MVPIVDLTDENLERRIQRIRERDEEIEKKHREAEEDRLAALQMNAMVKIKPSSDEYEWPRAHKYDTVDFTYDVEDNEFVPPVSDRETSKLKKMSKLSEFEGPPADPSYNFLADAERDGERRERNTNHVPSNTNNRKNLKSGLNNSFNRAKNHHQSGGNRNSVMSQIETRIHRQKSDDFKLRREVKEKIDTTPTSTRAAGPLKLLGGDYYTKHPEKSRSPEDISKERSKKHHSSHSSRSSHSSHSSHSSKHVESKAVKSQDNPTRDKSNGRAQLLSMITIPNPQNHHTKEKSSHITSSIVKRSVQDRLTRHQN